jgi:hypothetical protein
MPRLLPRMYHIASLPNAGHNPPQGKNRIQVRWGKTRCLAPGAKEGKNSVSRQSRGRELKRWPGEK